MADLGMPAPTLRARPAPGDRPAARHHRRAGTPPGAPVTVVPLAPMTNLALLARVHPQAFARIGRIVFMGGGVRRSATPPPRPSSTSSTTRRPPPWCSPRAPSTTSRSRCTASTSSTTRSSPTCRSRGCASSDTPVAHLAAGLISFHHRAVRQRRGDHRRRGRGRHPRRAGCRAHRAAAGAGRARRHLDPRPHRRRPPRLERRPRPRPARPGGHDGRRRPRPSTARAIADLWVRTVRGEAS